MYEFSYWKHYLLNLSILVTKNKSDKSEHIWTCCFLQLRNKHVLYSVIQFCFWLNQSPNVHVLFLANLKHKCSILCIFYYQYSILESCNYRTIVLDLWQIFKPLKRKLIYIFFCFSYRFQWLIKIAKGNWFKFLKSSLLYQGGHMTKVLPM